MAWFKKLGWSNGVAPALNATNLNSRDQGAQDANYGGGMPILAGVKTQLIYNGTITTQLDTVKQFDLDGTTLRVQIDLTYTSGNLSNVKTRIYDTDGTTILNEFDDPVSYNVNNLLEFVGARTVTV